MSIARAVVEHIDKRIHAKTLFATHYHELTELEGRLPGVNNYCVAVSKHDEDIIFLRKIIPGGADQSYGIDVAGLAGVPSPVIERAKEISRELSDADILRRTHELPEPSLSSKEKGGEGEKEREGESPGEAEPRTLPGKEESGEEAGAGAKEALRCLASLDLNRMTPLDAINTLYELREKLSLEH